ncbi:MAG TPA: carbon-nitrogen hydrolase [Acidimicrobiales bacterium]|nr:carbon-nitrogen hydrolase [Acidimicrobiales bacterium]
MVTLAVIQRAFGDDRAANCAGTVDAAAAAIAAGAQVVLCPELFESRYFPQVEDQDHFAWATTVDANPAVRAMQAVTAGTGAVVPVSFFEHAAPVYFNSIALVDDGEVRGVYRKAHIPDGPGYEEKFYFTPGDTGFRVWGTRHGRLGVGICWDQWFPECARAMTLMGADLLLYPTAIGNELGSQAGNDTADMWRRAMDGHAVCNHVPVAAANRVGTEGDLTFYGSSFVVDHRGRPLAEAGRDTDDTLLADVDLDRARADRAGWGLLRDRRPDLYGVLTRYTAGP